MIESILTTNEKFFLDKDPGGFLHARPRHCSNCSVANREALCRKENGLQIQRIPSVTSEEPCTQTDRLTVRSRSILSTTRARNFLNPFSASNTTAKPRGPPMAVPHCTTNRSGKEEARLVVRTG